MNKTETLSLKKCYSKAWKPFAKWWIPLCLVAVVAFVQLVLAFIPATGFVGTVRAAAFTMLRTENK